MNSTKKYDWTPADVIASLVLMNEVLARLAWDDDPPLAAHVTDSEDSAHEDEIRWAVAAKFVYPLFQYTLGEIDPQVAAATRRFREAFAPFNREPPLALWCAWWATPSVHLHMRTPLAVLRAGEHAAIDQFAQDWTEALIEGLQPSWTP